MLITNTVYLFSNILVLLTFLILFLTINNKNKYNCSFYKNIGFYSMLFYFFSYLYLINVVYAEFGMEMLYYWFIEGISAFVYIIIIIINSKKQKALKKEKEDLTTALATFAIFFIPIIFDCRGIGTVLALLITD